MEAAGLAKTAAGSVREGMKVVIFAVLWVVVRKAQVVVVVERQIGIDTLLRRAPPPMTSSRIPAVIAANTEQREELV